MKKLICLISLASSLVAANAYNFYYPFLGTTANDGTGDPLRTAGMKYNSNFMMIATSQGAVIQNVFTTNQFFNGYVDANSNVWLISATAVPMNTWNMPNMSLGGQVGNVPLIINSGGQSDGNVAGGQYYTMTNCGYNIGSMIVLGAVSYTTNFGGNVCTLYALQSSSAYNNSYSELVGADNLFTNCNSSQLGGAMQTYINDYGETGDGYNNSVTTCSFGFHGGAGNTSIGDMSQVTLGGTGSGANGNISLHNSDGYLNGAGTYALNNVGSTISALNSFCVSNFFCSISGAGQLMTNNYYSTFEGQGNYATNAVGVHVTGATNNIGGYTSYSTIVGANIITLNTNTGIISCGLSNTFAGMNYYVTGQGTWLYFTNCHNFTGTGFNCGFTNMTGVAKGYNGVVTTL